VSLPEIFCIIISDVDIVANVTSDVKNNIGFRSWYYFRTGWSVYFAFIFAAINTLTVTYFLAIENYPILKEIFPSFFHYIFITVVIGVPFLVLIGYAHYKRTPSYKAEADIQVEANPHFRRAFINTELMLEMFLEISQLTIKLSNNEKLTDNEIKRLKDLQNEFQEQIKNRVIKD
tara:strand:- start:1026 stop:1550 length:525 start_codon:yes stop_codon:yes gene_type:complete